MSKKGLKEALDLVEEALTLAEHGDYSNGIEEFGSDEGRVKAGEYFDQLRKKQKELLETQKQSVDQDKGPSLEEIRYHGFDKSIAEALNMWEGHWVFISVANHLRSGIHKTIEKEEVAIAKILYSKVHPGVDWPLEMVEVKQRYLDQAKEIIKRLLKSFKED